MSSAIVLELIELALSLAKLFCISLEAVVVCLRKTLDQTLNIYKPSQLIPVTFLLSYVLFNVLVHFRRPPKGTFTFRTLGTFFMSLPMIKHKIDNKINKIATDMKIDLLKVYGKDKFISELPLKGSPPETLLRKINHYQLFDTTGWQQGRISGAIYTDNVSSYNKMLLSVFGSHMWSNPLHADVFASVRKMEAEIISMVAKMYKGGPMTCGSVTSGGTESIIMACKAYRDYARKVKHIKGKLEIIAPVTAHAAFEKAANFLDCKIKHIPVDRVTYKVDMKLFKRAISPKTMMLVGSAPQFPHGIVDPISAIGKLGLERDIPVHVDACLGGFLLPFMKEAGFQLDESFDLTVPGVTSISADTHKYGYTPKGTSVILYRHEKYLHQQYSIQTDWPGGIYASPTMPGSRPGALIATTWASLIYHGQTGYVDATKKILTTAKFIRDELSQVRGIRLLGNPLVSVVSFASDDFDIYVMNDQLKQLGWNLNALQFPSAFHLCVTLMHTSNNVAKTFVRDVTNIARTLMNGPKEKPTGSAAIYGMSQTIPDRSLVAQIARKYLDACYALE